MAYWRLVILKAFPVLPVAVNLTSDGVIGMTPGGRPQIPETIDKIDKNKNKQ